MCTSISSYNKFIFLFIVMFNEISFERLNPNNLFQFNEKDGVPEIEIEKIMQNHLGNIRIPAGGGLLRYNGYEFNRYSVNPNYSNSIKSLSISTRLQRKLKALAGKSANQYFRFARLAKAKEKIEEETGNISRIAYSSGFSSPAYFSRCLKEEFDSHPFFLAGNYV